MDKKIDVIETFDEIVEQALEIENSDKTFKKAYVIDTNVILQNHLSPLLLSDNGENLIIITETVLQELDKFKVGIDDINFQAREFNRMLADAEIVKKLNNSVLIKKRKNEIEAYILLLKNKSAEEINDDKIIDTILLSEEKIKE